MRRIVAIFLMMLFCGSMLSAVSLPKPERDPVPPTEAQILLIKEGVRFHDQGDFEKAIANYQEALKINPDVVEALYELSFSQFAKGDYSESLATALKGAEYRSKLIDQLYLQIGNCLDSLGRTKEAIDVYKKAMKGSPSDSLLYFNLALAQQNLAKTKDAEKSFERALVLNPNHPGSHRSLGGLYLKSDRKISAMLAYLRFLVLEPRSSRADQLLPTVEDLLGAGVTQTGENQIVIPIAIGSGKNKLSGIDDMGLSLSIARGAVFIKKEGKETPTGIQAIAQELSTFFAIMGESSGARNKSFVSTYYVPYFVELGKKNMVEPFCYFIFQNKKDADISQWLNSHSQEVQSF
ncbi:MAG: tetratricopeptide repeat protein [Acidobacteriia bacterium]|nr:tetratricopeptide repeat protein [Terriglobia bacterium]